MPDTVQTLAANSGTDGRVKMRVGSAVVVVAGISVWRRTSSTGVIRLPHFEAPADPVTNVVQPFKLKGLGDNKVRLEGIYNYNAAAQTETGNAPLTNGAAVALDLLSSKSTSKGYPNVVGFVSNFEHGHDINDKAATFSCDVEVSGVFPTWGDVPSGT